MYWKRSIPYCNGHGRDKVTLTTTCIKNVKFKSIKIRTSCQYVGYFYYRKKLNWAAQNLHLVRMQPEGRGLDIADLNVFGCGSSSNHPKLLGLRLRSRDKPTVSISQQPSAPQNARSLEKVFSNGEVEIAPRRAVLRFTRLPVRPVVKYIFRGQCSCFHYMFEKNVSGHNTIWGSTAPECPPLPWLCACFHCWG